MRNVRQSKRSHSSISNLEDRLEGSDSKSSKIVGSTATAGLMKPPTDFIAKLSPPASPRSVTSNDLSDLEDQLVRELSNESC